MIEYCEVIERGKKLAAFRGLDPNLVECGNCDDPGCCLSRSQDFAREQADDLHDQIVQQLEGRQALTRFRNRVAKSLEIIRFSRGIDWVGK